MREQSAAALDLGDAGRRLANMIRPGTVAEIDPAAPFARVQYGQNPDGTPALTAWLPWLAPAAGGYRDWRVPSVGEQVLLLAPYGELAAAWILPGAYRDDYPAPESEAAKRAMLCPDGAIVSYDAEAHQLRAVLPEGGKVSLEAPGGVAIEGDTKIEGDVTIDGNLSVTGTIQADKAISSKADVSDKLGSMQEMRGVFNPHTHGVPPAPVTPPPNQRMA